MKENGFIETEIGRIPSDWNIEILKNLCTKIGSGATPKGGSNVYIPSGITLIRSQNVYDDGFNKQGLAFISESAAEKLQNVEVKEHDILLNITGDSICRVSIVPRDILPARVNQHVSIIRVNEKLYYRFLFYFLSLNKTKNKLLSYDAGGTRQALTKNMLEEFHVPLPKYKEQVKIGDFFWTISEKIALNRSMNSTLEAIGQALFRRWFVDFEFPDGEGKPYRSSGGEMVDSEIGEVPRGWRVGTLGDACAKITDGSHFSPKESDGNHLIATVRDMGTYDFDLNGCKKISDEDYQQLMKNGCKPEKGDILFSKDGTMGITHLYAGHQDIVLLSSIAIIRPKNNIYSNYIYLYLKSSSVQSLIFGGFVSGSALPRLVLKDIKKIPILIPPEKLIIQFNQIINNPLIQIIENEKQSRTLAALRDALLPKLMSGEIRVSTNSNLNNETK